MKTDLDQMVQKIHTRPAMAIIATTGGGTAVFPMLLEKGNGSSTLISGFIPYDPAEHEAFLGGPSDKWVAESDARSLAMVAFLRAQKYKGRNPVIGIGATVSLQRVERHPDGTVLNERDGRQHSIYIAMQTRQSTITHTLVFKNHESPIKLTDPLEIRVAEEQLTAKMMLNLLAEGTGLPDRCETGVEDFIVRKEATASEIHPSMQNVLMMEDPTIFVSVNCGNGLIEPLPNYNPPHGLIPGSFNPIHDGHRQMKSELESYLSIQYPNPTVGYEIAVRNADKPPIDYLSLMERLKKIADSSETSKVYLTCAPTFVQKSSIFHNCTFGCGYDTATRIIDVIYYNGSYDNREQAFAHMKENQARFMIFGRQVSEMGDIFFTFNDLEPSTFSQMCVGVHEERFRKDVRSTDIRRQEAGN